MALQTILNAKHKNCWEAERELFTRWISVLAAHKSRRKTPRGSTIDSSLGALLLVVVGEFNSANPPSSTRCWANAYDRGE